jgi:hypothetical protein
MEEEVSAESPAEEVSVSVPSEGSGSEPEQAMNSKTARPSQERKEVMGFPEFIRSVPWSLPVVS